MTKYTAVLIAMMTLCLTSSPSAELSVEVPPTPFDKDFGKVSVGSVLKLTVSSKCTLNGKTAGGIWVGGSDAFVPTVVFTANVPANKAGVHVGTFSGKYKECPKVASGGKAPDPVEKPWNGTAKAKSGVAYILKAVPCENVITVVLTIPGNVKLTLTGTTPYELSNSHHGVGSFDENFHFAKMPELAYSSVDMVFTPDGGGDVVNDSVVTKFQNLGMTRHSIYNVPDENDPTCQVGALVDVNVSNGPDRKDKCQMVVDQLFTKFKVSLDRNGTGLSVDSGLIAKEYLCKSQPAPKYRKISGVKGSCGKVLAANTAVAAYLAGKELSCNDKICIDPGGKKLEKVVLDNCPACSDGHHIDNFVGPGNCGIVPDLGIFITIKFLP